MPDDPMPIPVTPVDETPEQTTEQEPENWRKRPEAIAAFAAKSKLAELERQIAEDQSAKEQAEALQRGEHESVIAQLKADFEAERARHAAYKREAALENALVKEGAVNPVFLRGAIAGLGDSDIGEYVESLKKENADWFARPHSGIAAPSANPVPFSGKGTKNIDDLLAVGDPAARAEMLKKLLGG